MNIKKKIEKLRISHPEFKDLSDESLENWLEQRRDLGICALCPEHAKGLCCYGAVVLHTPSKWVCENHCTAYLRSKCTLDRDSLPEKSEKIILILPNHICKWLDKDTKLCTAYENRFFKRRDCLRVKDAIDQGAVPLDCPYLDGRKKKKYAKKPHKIWKEDIDFKGCQFLEQTWALYNGAQHEGQYGIYNKY